jgi:hypothetical protein
MIPQYRERCNVLTANVTPSFMAWQTPYSVQVVILSYCTSVQAYRETLMHGHPATGSLPGLPRGSERVQSDCAITELIHCARRSARLGWLAPRKHRGSATLCPPTPVEGRKWGLGFLANPIQSRQRQVWQGAVCVINPRSLRTLSEIECWTGD